MNKEVLIFPYINIDRIIKMDDFEIHPFKKYNFKDEITNEEKKILDEYVYSFRETFFKKWENPKIAKWIWILKYKWTILRSIENSHWIDDKIKILFLFLKLHVSHDFFNPWMNNINVKSFDIFWFNFKNSYTTKFWNVSECVDLHSTIPENISWIWDIKFYPLNFCINTIPVDFKLAGWWDEIFWINTIITDVTYLYQWIIKNKEYYQKILNIAYIHYWLEQQNDLFFYYAIIPTIIEVLNPPKWKKKQNWVEYWKKIDQLIKDNDFIKIISSWEEKELGLIARTISTIYDSRNDLLHEWKKSFDKLKVIFKWYELKIYDIFQLIFKYSILNDFIEQWIIDNNFSKLEFEWSIFTTWHIDVKEERYKTLSMDNELSWLLRKAESDKKYSNFKNPTPSE